MNRVKHDSSTISVRGGEHMKEFLADVYPFLTALFTNKANETVIFDMNVSDHDIRRIKIMKLQGKQLDERQLKIVNFFHYYSRLTTFMYIQEPIKKARRGRKLC